LAGERRAASENLSETTVEGGKSSSNVLGTNMQRLRPRATFAFFHLLPILLFSKISTTQKVKPS
jgi:hypothetical protein